MLLELLAQEESTGRASIRAVQMVPSVFAVDSSVTRAHVEETETVPPHQKTFLVSLA